MCVCEQHTVNAVTGTGHHCETWHRHSRMTHARIRATALSHSSEVYNQSLDEGDGKRCKFSIFVGIWIVRGLSSLSKAGSDGI